MNLNNCYVETKDKEALELFLNECERQGIKWYEGQEVREFRHIGEFLLVKSGELLQGDDMDGCLEGGGTKLTASDFKEKQMQEYEYELVNSSDEFKKGDILYIDKETQCLVIGWHPEHPVVVVDSNDGLQGIPMSNLYRRIKRNWYDNLDGTIENAVVCWVWECASHDKRERVILEFDGELFADRIGIKWSNATPLTKSELSPLLANAPE